MMGTFTVLMAALCLLVSLSDCNAGGEGNESLPTRPSSECECEPPIHTVLRELGALRERMAATEKTLEETNKKLQASDRKLIELTTAHQATARALEETNRKLDASDRKLSELNSTLTEQTTKSEAGQLQVAFSVAKPANGNLGSVSALYPLVYSRVLFNIGGHYSPVSGYFTAPVQGVYYLTFTSHCWGDTGICGGALYQNGGQKVSWYMHDRSHASSGTNSAILHLQVGDKVNIRVFTGATIHDNPNLYSTFSGFLLFPM